MNIIDFITKLYKRNGNNALHLLLDTKAELVKMSDGTSVESALISAKEMASNSGILASSAQSTANAAQNAALQAQNEAATAFQGVQQLTSRIAALEDLQAQLQMVLPKIGDIMYFLNPTLRQGYQPCYGGVIENIDTAYPQAWAFFQTEEGQEMCCSEAEWQEMTQDTWHTLADNTEIGWDGIGGAPKFVLDTTANTLRLPDLRGMIPVAAGGTGNPSVGEAAGDRMRNLYGYIGFTFATADYNGGALFTPFKNNPSNVSSGNTAYYFYNNLFNASKVVPTGSDFAPKRFGALPCAWLGIPGNTN